MPRDWRKGKGDERYWRKPEQDSGISEPAQSRKYRPSDADRALSDRRIQLRKDIPAMQTVLDAISSPHIRGNVEVLFFDEKDQSVVRSVVDAIAATRDFPFDSASHVKLVLDAATKDCKLLDDLVKALVYLQKHHLLYTTVDTSAHKSAEKMVVDYAIALGDLRVKGASCLDLAKKIDQLNSHGRLLAIPGLLIIRGESPFEQALDQARQAAAEVHSSSAGPAGGPGI